jgi:biopolymer transport protein ExbD
MASSTTQRGETITGINVTPLVDVVLVLLIVLMVTAGYIVSKTIPVDLPKSSTGETTRLTLAVTISVSGEIYLDAERVTEGVMRQRIRRAHARDPEARAVIAADGGTLHKRVVAIIDLLRQEGVSRFAINVKPDEVTPNTL